MPEILFDPLGDGEEKEDEVETPDLEVTGGSFDLGPVQPIASGERMLDPMTPVQSAPKRIELNPDNDLRGNINRVEAHPAYFSDLDRVHRTGLTRELIDEVEQKLAGEARTERAAYDSLLQRSTMSAIRSMQESIPGRFGREALGAAETGATLAAQTVTLAAEGVGSLIHAALTGGIEGQPDDFASRFISAQTKIAEAFGVVNDYSPVLEAGKRDLEGIQWLMENTVGALSQTMGEKTFEMTGSPALAAAATITPDAVLSALPLGPKAFRSIRNNRSVRQYRRELEASLQDEMSNLNLSTEIRYGDLEGLTPNNVELTIRNPNGESVGGIKAVADGDAIQIYASGVDETLHGKGIGRRAYEVIIEDAAARGYKYVESDSIVSEPASRVYESLRNRGYRVEKSPRAESRIVNGQNKLGTSGADPVYRIILDEPAATSSLQTTKMKPETLAALEGAKEAISPIELEALSNEMRAGRLSPEIIVETVQGTPTRITSGADVLNAMVYSADQMGVVLKNVRVRMQEAQNLTPDRIAMLDAEARSGITHAMKNQQAVELLEAQQTRGIRQKLKNLFVDTSGNVKAKLLQEGGPAGEAAVRKFSLMAGATPKAHMMYQDFFRTTYGRKAPDNPSIGRGKEFDLYGFRVSEVDMFNLLVQSRRTQAIVKSGGAKQAKGGGFQLEGAVRPQDAAGNIWAIRNKLGEKRFAQLEARADDVFDLMHGQLVRLQEAGLIDMPTYLRMRNIDYIRREFLEATDPAMLASNLKGKKVSIGESGVYHLGQGKRAAQNIDVQSLVAEYLVRTENRIFRNNANKALREVAVTEPENGFVMLGGGKKKPQGFSELRVMIDGEPERLFMKDLYAAEWLINDPGMSMVMANMFRILNGTFIVKPLATGMNPGFALVNFPRDIHHAWKATGDQYSNFAPMYLGQIFNDLRTVAKDAWKKEGRYRDFIDEGGGMNFLTHGGFDPLSGFSRQKDILRSVGAHRGKFGQSMHQLRETLSKVNEFSELAVRLALRERALRNQREAGKPPNPEEATFIARDYLDFSQGGSVTKAVESFIPYTNAASQAIRTSLREYGKGRRSATTAALKDLQVLTAKASVTAWAWMENPEGMAQVDPHAAYSNVVMPTGMSYIDENGNERHVMLKIAMDTTVAPFTSVFDFAIAKHHMIQNGIDPSMVPDSHWLEHVVSVIPIIGALKTGSPTFQATLALANNIDTWNSREIWTGDPFVKPGARTDERTEGTIYEDLGQLAPDRISPVQLQQAVKTYVPSNFYWNSTDFIRQTVERAVDPVQAALDAQRMKSDLTKETLANLPGLRRMIHVTHPAAQTTEELRQVAQEVQTWRAMEGEQIRRAIRDRRATGSTERFERLVERVASIRPQDAERVKDLFIIGVAVDEMYQNNEYDIGFVGQGWFNVLAGQDPETRAELVYWKWVELSNENARNLLAVMESIDKVGGRRIRTDSFNRHFAQMVSDYGHRSERVRPDMSEQPGSEGPIGATGPDMLEQLNEKLKPIGMNPLMSALPGPGGAAAEIGHFIEDPDMRNALLMAIGTVVPFPTKAIREGVQQQRQMREARELMDIAERDIVNQDLAAIGVSAEEATRLSVSDLTFRIRNSRGYDTERARSRAELVLRKLNETGPKD